MVVGKLRMKNTEEDLHPNQSYKLRKARQRTRSPSIDPPPVPYGPGKDELDKFPTGSSSLSRASIKRKSKQKYDSLGSKAEDEEFELKLKEALTVENDDLRLESLLKDDLYLPRRWGNHDGLKHSQAGLDGHQLSQLESEEYVEYIRKRMWSQSNRKHYLNSKHHEEQQHQESIRAQESSKKRKLDTKLKAEREASKKLKLKLKQQQNCRDRYLRRWEILNSLINSDVGAMDHKKTVIEGENQNKSDHSIRQVIEFEEIPWPIYTSDDGTNVASERGIEELNRSAIQEFLVGHLINAVDGNSTSKQTLRKKIIRNAILSYHPDRFNRLVHRIKNVNDSTEKAQAWGLRVSQILNELNQSID